MLSLDSTWVSVLMLMRLNARFASGYRVFTFLSAAISVVFYFQSMALTSQEMSILSLVYSV
uniref:Uncharacterized protein n=1 Tax=Kalanchoe fedtschenkoi TaxID=63787 RepID=A0A7N0T5I6_KALFE